MQPGRAFRSQKSTSLIVSATISTGQRLLSETLPPELLLQFYRLLLNRNVLAAALEALTRRVLNLIAGNLGIPPP